METTTPFPHDHPERPDAVRPQLHAFIERRSAAWCAALLAFLRSLREEPAPPPPDKRVGQGSAPPEPRP